MKLFLSETLAINIRSMATASMKVFLAESPRSSADATTKIKAMAEYKARRPVRILCSYHYFKDDDLEVLFSHFGNIPIEVFVDSGAYSAFTLGQKVDAGDYIAWVEKWKHLITVAAGPDVIGDPKATAAATERMLGEGLPMPVLPTFHVGEDWSWLQYWTSKVGYIAFGGMVPYSRQRNLLDAWISKAWKQLPEGYRVHGFGMTSWDLLVKYPWYSVDSSSWTSGFRYATMSLFDQQKKRLVTITMNDPKSLLANRGVLAMYGLRPSDCRADNYDRTRLVGVCIDSWQRVEEWLDRAHMFLVTSSMSAAPNNPQVMGQATKERQ